MRAGLRGVEDLAAGVALGRAVVTHRGLLALPRSERAAEPTAGPPGEVDHRGGVQRDLEPGQRVGKPGGVGGEGVGGRVPRQLTAGELLGYQIADVALVLDRNAQRSRRSPELVPRRIESAANRPCSGVRRPEDRGLVAGIEGADPTVRTDQARRLADIGEAQVAVSGPTERLVLVQDRADNQLCAGVGAVKDLAVGEVLAVPGPNSEDLALATAHHRRGPAGGVPRLIDRVCGVALRGGQGGRHHQCRGRRQDGDTERQAPSRPTERITQPTVPKPRHPDLPRSVVMARKGDMHKESHKSASANHDTLHRCPRNPNRDRTRIESK